MVEWVYSALVWLHVIFGFVGLATFWVPVFARKGGVIHVRSGKAFVSCVYVVTASAFVVSTWRIIDPFVLGRPSPETNPVQVASRAANTRAMFSFLGYLALVTLALTRQAVRVVQTRKDPESIRTPFHLALGWLSLAGSVAIILIGVFGPAPTRIVLFSLSPLGFIAGSSILKFAANPTRTKMGWWMEHMGAILAAGIAFHTAFTVFGFARIIDLQLTGPLRVLPWLLPTLIGAPAITIWTRYYRRKFGEI